MKRIAPSITRAKRMWRKKKATLTPNDRTEVERFESFMRDEHDVLIGKLPREEFDAKWRAYMDGTS